MREGWCFSRRYSSAERGYESVTLAGCSTLSLSCSSSRRDLSSAAASAFADRVKWMLTVVVTWWFEVVLRQLSCVVAVSAPLNQSLHHDSPTGTLEAADPDLRRPAYSSWGRRCPPHSPPTTRPPAAAALLGVCMPMPSPRSCWCTPQFQTLIRWPGLPDRIRSRSRQRLHRAQIRRPQCLRLTWRRSRGTPTLHGLTCPCYARGGKYEQKVSGWA